MTIELSLRRRAAKARLLAMLWLGLAVAILVCTYCSLPAVAGLTVNAISNIQTNIIYDGSLGHRNGASLETKSFDDLNIFAFTTLVLGVAAISFACYLLGKFAIIELESAERLRAVADALCVSGNDFEQLAKAVSLLAPKSQTGSSDSKFISTDDLKTLAEILGKLR